MSSVPAVQDHTLLLAVTPTAKARLRLLAVAIAMVPVAILARLTFSESLLKLVQRALSWAERGAPPPSTRPLDAGDASDVGQDLR